MCGKFTAMYSWREVVAFSQPLTREDVRESDNDRVETYRVMTVVPVIVWDAIERKRRVIPMRWGWPNLKNGNWKVPKHIHARGETIDELPSFAPSFRDGQRGIVVMRTFNEAPDIPGPSIQHTITPGDIGALGVAFIYRQFEVPEVAATMPATIMVTMPANELIAKLPTDRMPAVLRDEDWKIWLGEEPADLARVKACLKTVEGVNWTMTEEQKAATTKRKKPTVSDPGGLF